MTRNTIYWICQLSGWSLYFIINTSFQFVMNEEVDPALVAFQIISTIYLLLVSHAFRMFVHKREWLKIAAGKLIPRLLLAIVIMGFLAHLLEQLTLVLIGQLSTFVLAESMLNWLTHATLYFIWCVIYIMYHYIERYNATLKYEAAINEMTLNRLKSQLNPHFIFNALNSIRALVDEEPKKAKMAITQLSNILRNSLVMDKRREVPFAAELQTVKDYLELEGIRFEERLRTSFNISPDAQSFPIPPMMLQTLVENGIKHGISNLIEGGLVRVDAFVRDDKLHICIRNSGQYINGVKKKNSGLGIANTKERLKLLYGNKASFNIRNEDDQTVLTEVVIPQQ